MRCATWLAYSLVCFCTFSASAFAESPPPPDLSNLEQEAQAITQQFGKELKTVLQATIMTSGPVEAIRVCNTSAPKIAQQLAQQKGWEVGRTSHKVRNPDNAPDQWEQDTIALWQNKIARGAPVENMKASQVIVQGGVATYRYMSAIPTGGLCLNCHGTSISGPVNNALNDLYPTDQATGFIKGELRGAFSLQKAL